MRRAFEARIELFGRVEPGNAIVQPAHGFASPVELLLLVEDHAIQRLQVMLEMRDQDFEIDDALLQLFNRGHGGVLVIQRVRKQVMQETEDLDKIRLAAAALKGAERIRTQNIESKSGMHVARRIILGLLFLMGWCRTCPAADFEFELRYDPQLRKEPFSGRVYLFFNTRQDKEPRDGPDAFNPQPIIAVDVRDWKGGELLRIGKSTGSRMLAFPRPYAELNLAGYRVQGVARFNPWERKVGVGAGNVCSKTMVMPFAAGDKPIPVTLDLQIPEAKFPENQWSKLLRFRSPLLSEFYRRDTYVQAGILLPASYYKQPQRRYPVIFKVPGFSSTHFDAARATPIEEDNPGGVEFIRVTLDASCPLGHHVFADSANNGPVGESLIKEFLPEFDKRYRTIPEPTARFLTGHSSGGWSTLWLQITYPETFGGTWSTSPDPVDFHDFQRIDLYAPGVNMYRDEQGMRRPISRVHNGVQLWYDDFVTMETVVGHGGQMHSFEAVFSPRGPKGHPRIAWDRATGAVRSDVIQAWKKYDLRLILESRWKELEPRLRGKLHIYVGDADTFLLESSVWRLQRVLTRLGSDAVVETYQGFGHFGFPTESMVLRFRQEMAESFLKHHPGEKRTKSE